MAFAGYAFNKPHAAGYSYLTYQTAWCKYHYPVQTMCALLNSFLGNLHSAGIYLQACKRYAIKVLPLDINESQVRFATEILDEIQDNNLGLRPKNFGIRFGLAAVKNVGTKILYDLVSLREKNGKFKDMSDFLWKSKEIGLNKKMIESLILAGAFDCFEKNRAKLLRILLAFNSLSTPKSPEIMGQMSLFSNENPKIEVEEVDDFSNERKLAYEKEMLGIYVSAHPLDAYQDIVSKLANSKIIEDVNYFQANEEEFCLPALVLSVTNLRTKKNENMAFVRASDMVGEFEAVFFPKAYEKYRELLVEDKVLALYGNIRPNNRDEGANSFIVNRAYLLEELAAKEKHDEIELVQDETILNKKAEFRLVISIRETSDEKELKFKIRKFLNWTQNNRGDLGLSFYLASKDKMNKLSYPEYSLSSDENVLAEAISYWQGFELKIESQD